MIIIEQILTGSFNTEIIKYIQSFHNPVLDGFFTLITMSAEEYAVIAAMAVIFWCVNKSLGYKLGMAFLSSALINTGFKELFHIARPIGEHGIRSLRIETAGGYSFPSGHSQGASVLWTSIMIKFKKRLIYTLGITLIILVGISRLYLGVHRPVDVIAGIIIGVSWTFISNYIFSNIEKNNNYYLFLIYLIPTIIIMCFFKDVDFYKMAGVMLSLCMGYILESKYIKFNVKCGIVKHSIKLIIGIIVVLLIQSGLKIIFPDLLIFHFIRYFFIGIWVTVGAPYIFQKLPDIKGNSNTLKN